MPARIALPSVAVGSDHELSTFYGADLIAAEYCGLRPPLPAIRGHWQHGWHPSFFAQAVTDPIWMIGRANAPDPATPYFVALNSQRDFLVARGFSDVHVIGLPVVYLPPAVEMRERGSLLVMTPHSASNTFYDWDGEAYADAIDAVRDRFRRVAVCIHPSCWLRGYWVEPFRRRGYEVFQSATGRVANPLAAQRDLLSRYEYVTSNGFGSHLVYAAYFGCKVSLYGPWAVTPRQGMAEIPGYGPYGRYDDSMSSEATCLRWLPFLFSEPQDAPERREWAEGEVGLANKRSPAELAVLFGWGSADRRRLRRRLFAMHARRAIASWAPDVLKRLAKRRRGVDAVTRERARLMTFPPLTRGRSTLLGPEIEFADARAFLAAADEIFQRQTLRFESPTEAPTVIDGGAGIGLGVLYAKALYPHARVIAFEPNPFMFEILESNVQRFELGDVVLRNEAISIAGDGRSFRLGPSHVGGRFQVRPSEPDIITVKTTRLRDLLREPVDLLKLTISGAEGDVLADCADALGEVRHAFVRVYSFIDRAQRLDVVLRVLTEAGMRVNVEAKEPATRPLLERNIRAGMDSTDMIVDVWGYRR